MSEQWVNKKAIFDTRPLKKGTDELINPRIDRIIETVISSNNKISSATAYLKRGQREEVDEAIKKLKWCEQELIRIKRQISNHCS